MADRSEIRPVTERISNIQKRFKAVEYREMYCDSERTRILTESYQRNEADFPLIKRAKFFYELCEQMTVRVEDWELIVGNQGRGYRFLSPYVEWDEKALFASVCGDDEKFRLTWQTDGARQKMTDEDREVFRSVADYWSNRSLADKTSAVMPDAMWDLHKSGAMVYGDPREKSGRPYVGHRCQGHFCANYDKLVHKGARAIREEAAEHMRRLEGACYGEDGEKYIFYRAVTIVCDGMCLLARRYGAECARMAEEERFPEWRKKELRTMAEMLSRIPEEPCKTYWEAMMAINLYMLCLCLDAQNHGVTFGRLDQYAGHFLEDELKNGTITMEFAQEICDSFILKTAEYTRCETHNAPEVIHNADGTVTYKHNAPTIETGQHFSVGGVKKDGTDATNELTYTLIQCYARLYMYSPSLSLRVHEGTPEDLWKLAVKSSSIAGGMPTFENDGVIIPALMKKGYAQEDANNYCLIGCVEPAGCGNEWPCCGSSGSESFWNYAAAIVLAMNNGTNPLNGYCGGPKTGYLYEMETFDQFREALRKQAEFYLGWHVTCCNIAEYAYRLVLPCPLASATMDGCMESGLDVTYGGSKYNSTGVTCCGIGNVADSLAAIKYLCFDKKIVTTRKLYDAVMANWVGYEELREYITGECPHYGNDDNYVDEQAVWAMNLFCDIINNATGPRGGWRPGTFTMTTNVMFGAKTAATPDGRYSGEPLAEAISPKQGLDVNGPTAYLKSAAKLPHIDIGNGDQLNIKFSKTVTQNAQGMEQIKNLIRTYFDLGGMQVQFNVVSVEELHDAQAHPENHKNLIVRIAGFSAAFVELPKKVQDDFITRTEHAL